MQHPSSTHDFNELPVAVLGAGPIGLAAAAHLLECGLRPVILEAGRVGESIRAWGHVKLFSPWGLNVDPLSRRMLEAEGWQAPDDALHPTGHDLVERYLEPFAALPRIAPHLRQHTRVLAVSRLRHDKMQDAKRHLAPFILHLQPAAGSPSAQNPESHHLLARAVIDATGTWTRPNPMTAHGLPAVGEDAAAAHIRYGIPDVLAAERSRYAGRRVAVVGSGHSAFNALLDLISLRREVPDTEIFWLLRRPVDENMFSGPRRDQLAARGRLGEAMKQHWQDGAVQLVDDFALHRIEQTGEHLRLIAQDRSSGPATLEAIDQVIVATGFRPDLDLLRELRLDLDPATESPRSLAPLIDPNLHSCGTVPAHGAHELAHPEQDLFVVGMKSYGRAPTFLLRTGYEQVRSIAHALAGDQQGARPVDLNLPATGACKVDIPNPLKVSCC